MVVKRQSHYSQGVFRLACTQLLPTQPVLLCVGKDPLGESPDLILSSLRPKGLVWVQVKESLVLTFICVWLLNPWSVTSQWGYFKYHHRDYFCYSCSEHELQLPNLWFSGAGKPKSVQEMFSPIITHISVFPPLICKRQTINSARRRLGLMGSCFTVIAMWEGWFSGFSPLVLPLAKQRERSGCFQNHCQMFLWKP